MAIKSLYSRVCFLSYIPYGNPCVRSDCSRLLVCACVHVFIPGAALRFCRVVCCSIVLFSEFIPVFSHMYLLPTHLYFFCNFHFNIVFASATSKRCDLDFPTTAVRMSLLYLACHMSRPPYDLAMSTDYEAARYVVFSSLPQVHLLPSSTHAPFVWSWTH